MLQIIHIARNPLKQHCTAVQHWHDIAITLKQLHDVDSIVRSLLYASHCNTPELAALL
jgi:hypothetical protein